LFIVFLKNYLKINKYVFPTITNNSKSIHKWGRVCLRLNKIPTEQDYQNSEFQRYFCKKTNEIQYIEIDLDQFTKLKAKDPQILFSLYQPFTITWVLTGNKEQVAKINKNIVELASFRQKLFRFGDYLKFDYLKYYK
jgi:hypothetical protein